MISTPPGVFRPGERPGRVARRRRGVEDRGVTVTRIRRSAGWGTPPVWAAA